MNTVFFTDGIFPHGLPDQGSAKLQVWGYPVEKTVDTGMLIYKGLRHSVDEHFSHIRHGFWRLFLIL